MNWEERIIEAGAPGPIAAKRHSRIHFPHERLTETSHARATVRFDSPGAIVVGVEDSDRSTDALALAELLAGALGARLVLVHNQPPEGAQEFLEPEDDQLLRSLSASGFARVQDLLRNHEPPGLRIAHAVTPAGGLRQIAQEENVQLIVVGASQRSGFARVRPGSVGEQLLSGARVAHVPVAVAPRGYADAHPSLSRIASAFDGSPESRLALHWAAALAATNAARVRVITVHAPIAVAGLGFAAQSVDPIRRGDLERDQAAAIADLGGPVEGLVLDGKPAGVLVDASRQADLLVMGSRGYGPMHAVLLGSVSHYVVRRASCPVVICPRESSSPTAGAAGFPGQQSAAVG
jgi:nucleotide-binding universal stress UspA family protein